MLGSRHRWYHFGEAVVEMNLLALDHSLRNFADTTCPFPSVDGEMPRVKWESQPARLMNRSIYSLVRRRQTRPPVTVPSSSRGSAFLGPLRSLSALWNQAKFIVILAGGITYTIQTCLAASLSAAVVADYDMNYLTTGLICLPNRYWRYPLVVCVRQAP